MFRSMSESASFISFHLNVAFSFPILKCTTAFLCLGRVFLHLKLDGGQGMFTEKSYKNKFWERVEKFKKVMGAQISTEERSRFEKAKKGQKGWVNGSKVCLEWSKKWPEEWKKAGCADMNDALKEHEEREWVFGTTDVEIAAKNAAAGVRFFFNFWC